MSGFLCLRCEQTIPTSGDGGGISAICAKGAGRMKNSSECIWRFQCFPERTDTSDLHQQSPAINLSPASSPGGKYSASYLWSSNVITADDSVQCPWSSSAARACFFTANTKQGSTSHPDFWIMYSIQIFAWVGNILWSWDLVVSFSRYCIKITENQTSPLFSKRTSVCF